MLRHGHLSRCTAAASRPVQLLAGRPTRLARRALPSRLPCRAQRRDEYGGGILRTALSMAKNDLLPKRLLSAERGKPPTEQSGENASGADAAVQVREAARPAQPWRHRASAEGGGWRPASAGPCTVAWSSSPRYFRHSTRGADDSYARTPTHPPTLTHTLTIACIPIYFTPAQHSSVRVPYRYLRCRATLAT